MKHKFFRIAAILLCFSVLLVLVGCGAKPSPAPNETEQTAKKLFSDKWKEITSGEAMPDEISVNPHLSRIVSSSETGPGDRVEVICGYLKNAETKQEFFDACKNLDISTFELGSAPCISDDVYEISFHRKSGLRVPSDPRLYIDSDGSITIVIHAESNTYIMHGSGLNYEDFTKFTRIDERKG